MRVYVYSSCIFHLSMYIPVKYTEDIMFAILHIYLDNGIDEEF